MLKIARQRISINGDRMMQGTFGLHTMRGDLIYRDWTSNVRCFHIIGTDVTLTLDDMKSEAVYPVEVRINTIY